MEQNPHQHLEDIILPEAGERSYGWDIDREFGRDAKDRMIRGLRREASQFKPEFISLELDVALNIVSDRKEDALEMRNERIKAGKELVRETLGTANLLSPAYTSVWLTALTGEVFGTRDEREKIGEIIVRANVVSTLQQGGFDYLAGQKAAYVRILTGQLPGTPEEWERMEHGLRDYVQDLLERGETSYAATYAAWLRIFRAHEIKLIPGKGLEIIDDPPQEFTRETRPLPEVRQF